MTYGTPCAGYYQGCNCPSCKIDAAEERREWQRNIRENHDCDECDECSKPHRDCECEAGE